jgi:hypothetical protein
MALYEYLRDKLKEKLARDPNQDVDSYQGVDDWETRDKRVRGLRRQVRRIMDKEESVKLKAIIARDEKERDSAFWNPDNILNYNTYEVGGLKKKGKSSKKSFMDNF